MTLRKPPFVARVLVVALGLSLSGCGTIAPEVISRDRVNFSHELTVSWQRQLLLNIVKLRYLDMPMFMDVSQVVAGYNIESSIRLLGLNPFDANGTLNLGAEGKYIDRPTISYTPLTGSKYFRNLLHPIPPAGVLFMLNSGWDADMILPVTVDTINGIRGPQGAGTTPEEAHPEFEELVTLIRRLQLSRAISMRIKDPGDEEHTVVIFRDTDIDKATQSDLERVRELLQLEPGRNEFDVIYAAVPRDGATLALYTRSILSIMLVLASRVEVPASDLEEGRALPAKNIEKGGRPDLLRIHSGDSPPATAFIAVPYRNKWFWVDDRDLVSKRTIAFMMILFSLSEGEGKSILPVLTIPTG